MSGLIGTRLASEVGQEQESHGREEGERIGREGRRLSFGLRASREHGYSITIGTI